MFYEADYINRMVYHRAAMESALQKLLGSGLARKTRTGSRSLDPASPSASLRQARVDLRADEMDARTIFKIVCRAAQRPTGRFLHVSTNLRWRSIDRECGRSPTRRCDGSLDLSRTRPLAYVPFLLG